MTSLVDYAGLFPPAALSMGEAAAQYSQFRNGSFGWALGRFVVPASALDELEEATRGLDAGGTPWRLGALAGAEFEADVARILGFNNRHARGDEGWTAVVDTVETRLDTPTAVQKAARSVPGGLALYGEVPAGGAGRDVVAALAEAGARAKLRTGGTTASLFPSTEEVVRFLDDCSSLAVPFKLTAGLHHALRGQYPLTGEATGEAVWMHGFVNVFLAAAFLDSGMDLDMSESLLGETAPDAFRFEDDRIAWRDYWISTSTLADARKEFALSFGSCSFSEPLQELAQGGLLD